MRINYLIKTSPVRLIDSESNQVGVVDIEVALDMAKEVGLDLVEIAPNSSPPVCRIMDFGKFKYQQKQKVKQSHKKQHNVVVKEIRLRPKLTSMILTRSLDMPVNLSKRVTGFSLRCCLEVVKCFM